MLDEHVPYSLSAVYRYVVRELVASGLLKQHFENGGRVLALDGTQHHSSEKVSCERCSKVDKDGGTRDRHTVVLPVIVSAGRTEVLSREPEFVLCKKGKDQQDCASAAAKRWLYKPPQYDLGKVLVLGDDLYCRQPTCETVLEQGCDFVFVCKPSSHRTLYHYLELSSVAEVSLTQGQGKKRRTTTYRFVNTLPLRDSPDALYVNWCDISEPDANGKTNYHAFASNLQLGAQTVVRIAAWERARWKVDNKANNVLNLTATTLSMTSGMASSSSQPCSELMLLAFFSHPL